MSDFDKPVGWHTIRLGEYIYLKNGYAFKSQNYRDKTDGLVPVIRISDLQSNIASTADSIYVDPKAVPAGFEVKKGDLLIAMSGATTGKTGVYFSDAKAFQNQRVGNIKLLSEENGSHRYRDYLIKSLSRDILEIAHGGAQPNISGMAIEKMKVVLPPLNEQKRIANKLDELLGQVDTIKARVDAIPDILKLFRQSVLAAAAEGRLIDSNHQDTKAKVILLGDVSSQIRYGTSKKCGYETGTTSVIRIPNIRDFKIDMTDRKSADFSDQELTKLKLEEGDLLFIRSNGSLDLVGKCALVTNEFRDCLFAGYLIRVRFDDLNQVLPKYVLYCLQSLNLRQQIERVARSTNGVNNINSKELACLEFRLPEIEEQKRIARGIESLFSFVEQCEQRVRDAQSRIDQLTQSILAKAFRGELVPQDPNDESASELLARIQEEREAAAKLAKAAKKTVKKKKS